MVITRLSARFANVFNGNFDDYDPRDAAHRTDVEEYTVDNTTKCSVFRTFQGWTALSDMLSGQGLLHVVPIPEAMAYVLLRPLLDDVPDDELCGVARQSSAHFREMASTTA